MKKDERPQKLVLGLFICGFLAVIAGSYSLVEVALDQPLCNGVVMRPGDTCTIGKPIHIYTYQDEVQQLQDLKAATPANIALLVGGLLVIGVLVARELRAKRAKGGNRNTARSPTRRR
jgi:hypothetical protein